MNKIAEPAAKNVDTGNSVSKEIGLKERVEIGMPRITALAIRAQEVVDQVRGKLLAPESKKKSPMFSTAQLAALCGVDKAHINYRVSKDDLPPGKLTLSGARREFDLESVRVWTRTYRAEKMRPPGKRAKVIAVANFKGGVAKTTSAMVLSQGLSMRGHRVLSIDVDPQGSLTTLHGILPETEVTEDMTILPVCLGLESDISNAIRSSYWNGMDIVCAASFLFGAEFSLPAMRRTNPKARFWDVLNKAIDPIRDLYDVIVIDTPPSLSYVTINALWAADGIIVPVPPSGLDFASSAQFWSLLSDLGTNLENESPDEEKKVFDFLHVVLSKVDPLDQAAPAVRQWITATYGEFMLPVEIPKTSVTTNMSAEFATVYDVQKYDGSAKTYKRATDAYDRYVELIEESVCEAWKRGN